jgi:hypothetical protein
MRYVRSMRQRSHHRTAPWFLAHVARLQRSASAAVPAAMPETSLKAAAAVGKRPGGKAKAQQPGAWVPSTSPLAHALFSLMLQFGDAVAAGRRFLPPACVDAKVDHHGRMGGVCAAAMDDHPPPPPLNDTWRCFLDTAAVLPHADHHRHQQQQAAELLPAAPQWLGRNTAWQEFSSRYLSRPAVRT